MSAAAERRRMLSQIRGKEGFLNRRVRLEEVQAHPGDLVGRIEEHDVFVAFSGGTRAGTASIRSP